MKALPYKLPGEASVAVTHDNTAAALGSGSVEVFATPFLVALMEEAAQRSLIPYHDEGETSVGVDIDIRHTAASPVGATVCAKSELISCDGRRCVFHITASDDFGPVGDATHTRAVIDEKRFYVGIEKRKAAK